MNDPERKNVYLDGISCDDSLDGKLGKVVKSFAVAKEITISNKKNSGKMVIDAYDIAKNSHLLYWNIIIVNRRAKIYNINNKAIKGIYMDRTYTSFFCFNSRRILSHRLII